MRKYIFIALYLLLCTGIKAQTDVPMPRDSIFRTQTLDGTSRLWFFLGKKNTGGALFWDTSKHDFKSYYYDAKGDTFAVKGLGTPFDSSDGYIMTSGWKWILDNHPTDKKAISVVNKRDSNDVYGIYTEAQGAAGLTGTSYALYAKATEGGAGFTKWAGYFDGNVYFKDELKADTLKLAPTYLKVAPYTGQSYFHSSIEQIGNRAIYNNFTSGWAGSGYKIDYGVKTANKSDMEIDNLTVRGRLSVYELLIRQIRATNGNLFVTSSAKVDSVYTIGSNKYIRFDDPTGSNLCPFTTNDLLKAQRYSPSGTLVRIVELQVIGVSGRTIQYVLNTGSDAVILGEELVRIGNTTDISRSSSIYLAADDTYSPYIDLIDSVQSFSDWGTSSKIKARLGKLDGITDGDFGGALSGYGLYAENVYLKGKIKISSNSDIIGLTIPSADYSYGATFPASPETGDWFYYTTNKTWYRYDSGWIKMSSSQTYIDDTGLYTGTIIADKIYGGSFVGQTFTGGSFIGSTFTGGTFQTDTTGQRIVINNSNTIAFYDSSEVGVNLYGYDGHLYTNGQIWADNGIITGAGGYAMFGARASELTKTSLDFNVGFPSPSTGYYTATRLDTGGLYFYRGSLIRFLYANGSTLTTNAPFDANRYLVNGLVGTAGHVLRSNGSTGFVASAIGASDLPTGIDATKIANGTITNTEFQYLDGLNGRVIDLLSDKMNINPSSIDLYNGLSFGSYRVSTLTSSSLTFGQGYPYPTTGSYTRTTLNGRGLQADTITGSLVYGTIVSAGVFKPSDAVGTAGQVLRSNGSTGFVASAIQTSDLPATISATSINATSYKVEGSVGTGGYVLRSDGSTGFVGSPIGASDLPSEINAAKIANGSVSNTEFQYLDGLTDTIANLLSGKVSTSGSYSNPGWITGLAFSKITGFATSAGSSGYYVATSSGGAVTKDVSYLLVGGYKLLYIP